MAKSDVPAETLPVLTRTELVAAMPVPASPSGGQNGMPGCKSPLGSSSFAPSSVSTPASAPAGSTCGRMTPKIDAGKCPELLEHFCIVVERLAVDREHARAVSDTKHALARQPPMDIASQRCQIVDLRGMCLTV